MKHFQTKNGSFEISERDKDGSLTSLHKLWSLIPDVSGMTNDELVQFLLDRVLYNERKKPFFWSLIRKIDRKEQFQAK